MNDKSPTIQTIIAVIVALLCLASGCSFRGLSPQQIDTKLTVEQNKIVLEFQAKMHNSESILK